MALPTVLIREDFQGSSTIRKESDLTLIRAGTILEKVEGERKL